jgi:hypothetical protein
MAKQALALALLVTATALGGCHHNSSGVADEANRDHYIRLASCFRPPFPFEESEKEGGTDAAVHDLMAAVKGPDLPAGFPPFYTAEERACISHELEAANTQEGDSDRADNPYKQARERLNKRMSACTAEFHWDAEAKSLKPEDYYRSCLDRQYQIFLSEIALIKLTR